jgi:para-nitrobenzyl esterase
MSGRTRDEHRLFVGLFRVLAGQPVTAQQYPTLLADAFGEYAGRVHAQYPESTFDSPSVAWASVLTDRMWGRSTFEQLQLFAVHVPTYAYEFADRSPDVSPIPGDFPPGAFHAADVPYLFNDDKFEAAANPAQRRLSAQMMRYWANFAHTGDPNGDGLRTGHFSTAQLSVRPVPCTKCHQGSRLRRRAPSRLLVRAALTRVVAEVVTAAPSRTPAS